MCVSVNTVLQCMEAQRCFKKSEHQEMRLIYLSGKSLNLLLSPDKTDTSQSNSWKITRKTHLSQTEDH